VFGSSSKPAFFNSAAASAAALFCFGSAKAWGIINFPRIYLCALSRQLRAMWRVATIIGEISCVLLDARPNLGGTL
jgi:hypothetical protein